MFITFEGIEGSGKTTQMGLLAQELRHTHHDVVLTREPGGTPLGQLLRRVLVEPHEQPIDRVTELLLYAADRRQHVIDVIQPGVDRNAIVLCDRFTDSTLAYQGFGRLLDLDALRNLNDWATGTLRPDLTLLFDVDETLGLHRAKSRNLFAQSNEGRFEAEDLLFHRRVREGYLVLALAEPSRFVRIDGSGSIEDVFARTLEALKQRAPRLFS
ncbi:MAG TPA: dTMP kinase [Thermoanaerobaculia bacterium]|nr:dTMP kinase [Thermoanaerobaculia bacterium]